MGIIVGSSRKSGGSTDFTILEVATLPPIGKSGIIYKVPAGEDFQEFIWASNKYQPLGTKIAGITPISEELYENITDKSGIYFVYPEDYETV